MSKLLETLNEQQREVVRATHGPVLVLAGAGSGKTRALTHRIAYLVEERIASPSEILAVTFTNKAAQEMKDRVYSLLGSREHTPSSVGTFHGIGARMLREQDAHHSRSRHFLILDAKDSERLVRRALQEVGVSLREWNPKVLKHRISHAKSDLLMPSDVQQAGGGPADEMLARIYTRYEKLLAEHNSYDFDDLLRVPFEMLRDNEAIRLAYQQRWRFISVDEYQDTNPLQDNMISLLLGSEKNLCVVGDDYQAIYSWRGARVDHILNFEKTHPDCTTIYLTRNYRSTPQILELANHVISLNTHQKHKKLWTSQRGGNAVEYAAMPSDIAEAKWVCQQLVDFKADGGRLGDCAILYRTNAQSRLFEEQFLIHRMPYTVIGGFRFYDRREVKDALSFLYFWVHPSSRLHFERLSDALLKRVGPKTLDVWEARAKQSGVSLEQHLSQEAEKRVQLKPLMRAFRKSRRLKFERVSELLRELLTVSGYLDWLKIQSDGEERVENIDELLNVTAEYTDVHVFLEDAALLSDIDTMEQAHDRITCMSLHASKGLEFPRVYVVGCEEGLLPHMNSMKEDQMEEERRLMYVGMTRARERLTLTRAEYRHIAGEMTPQLASRFLDAIPDSVSILHEQMSNTDNTTRRDDIAEFLHASDDGSEPVIVTASVGEYITHPQFGRGIVIQTHGSSLTCVFEGHGVKTFDGAIVNSEELL